MRIWRIYARCRARAFRIPYITLSDNFTETPEDDERGSDFDGRLDTEENECTRGGFSTEGDGDGAFGGAVKDTDNRDGKCVLLQAAIRCWWHCGRVGRKR